MVAELPIAVIVAAVVLLGLWISNTAYDHGIPHYISRKIGHGAGGLAFLGSLLFTTAWWPLIVSAVFGALLLAAHVVKPHFTRGVGGTGRDRRIMAEVWFPLVALPVFGISWLWFGHPEIAVVSLLFMAWGDGVTGLVRAGVYHRPVKGLRGSLAMLALCLIVAAIFIKPFWIGVAASAAATITESSFGEYGIFKWADDNWAIPLVSMAVILSLTAVTGNL